MPTINLVASRSMSVSRLLRDVVNARRVHGHGVWYRLVMGPHRAWEPYTPGEAR